MHDSHNKAVAYPHDMQANKFEQSNFSEAS